MSVYEVLCEAKRRVEQGWFQGDVSDGGGNVCLRAAIALAAGVWVERDGRVGYALEPCPPLWSLLRNRDDIEAANLVAGFLPSPFSSISSYNDDPGTTLADVVAVLDKALAVAR